MKLTDRERSILSGHDGRGRQRALEIVVRFGELYHAESLLEVKNAHIDAGAYSTIWDSGLEFVESLVEDGARVAVPTTINPRSHDEDPIQQLRQSREFAAKSRRLSEAYLKMGVSPTWTCTPYECTNSPSFGEVVSWSESNAVNYLNSVLGARSNRLPDLVDVCCAVAGRVPAFGLCLTENRAGQILFDVGEFPDAFFLDYGNMAALGYLVGEIAVNRIPVLKGVPAKVTKSHMKTFSAAAASGGAVALFHMVGITPEAPSAEAAFQGRKDYETVAVTAQMVEDVYHRLSRGSQADADLVLLGCPHLSYFEIRDICDRMRGRRVAEGMEFWIQTSRTMYELLSRSGIRQEMEALGVAFLKDTCVLELDADMRWRYRQIATNSGKLAQYLPGMRDTRLLLCDTAVCVELAVGGEEK